MALKSRRRRHPLILALISKRNVMNAVMLRDMRSRFFNHGLGFAMVPLWPFVHMVIIIIIHAVIHPSTAFGASPRVYIATGLIPTITFMYITRFMGFSMLINRSMTNFPVVKMLDVMLGRAALEIIGAFMSLSLMLFALWAIGDEPFPIDMEAAVAAYLATIFLSVGVGTLVGVLIVMFPFANTIWALTLIVFYITSGTMIPVATLPAQISYPMSFSPVFQCVEWMRTGYFEGYSDKLLNKTYVLSFGVICLFLGLTLERLTRRRLLEG
jgi:capsular polysaccharide transport system permease protein